MLITEINTKVSNTSLKVSNTVNKISTNTNLASSSFESSYNSKSNKELENKLKDIKNKGNKLIKTQTYIDALSYKKAIQSYLSEVLMHMYALNKSESLWENNYYSVIDTVDKELCDLTEKLLKEEQSNIDILKNIYKIEGLLVELKV